MPSDDVYDKNERCNKFKKRRFLNNQINMQRGGN